MKMRREYSPDVFRLFWQSCELVQKQQEEMAVASCITRCDNAKSGNRYLDMMT